MNKIDKKTEVRIIKQNGRHENMDLGRVLVIRMHERTSNKPIQKVREPGNSESILFLRGKGHRRRPACGVGEARATLFAMIRGELLTSLRYNRFHNPVIASSQ
jgi:hypothetical protein